MVLKKRLALIKQEILQISKADMQGHKAELESESNMYEQHRRKSGF